MIDKDTELVFNGQSFELGDRELPDFLRENDLPFFLSCQEYVKDKVKKWIDIIAAGEKDPEKAEGMKDLIRYMDESPALTRLLNGLHVEPVLIKSYGMAWYDLMEKGCDYCMDCYTTNLYNEKAFRIDGEKWFIDHKISDNRYVVRYEDDPTDTLYYLVKMDQQLKEEILHPRLRKLSDGKEKYSWMLQLIGGSKNGGTGD